MLRPRRLIKEGRRNGGRGAEQQQQRDDKRDRKMDIENEGLRRRHLAVFA
jgi:hypothetical protein